MELEVVALDRGDEIVVIHVNVDGSAEVSRMTGRTRYVLGADVPDREVLRDSKGRIVDEAYLESAVEDAVGRAGKRGRPSLSKSGESPLLRVRISSGLDEAVIRRPRPLVRAERWVRRTLSRAVRGAG